MQRDALQKMLEASGLSSAELAERAGIRADTFRKYLGGYQVCGRQTMIAIEQVVAFETKRFNSPDDPLRAETVEYARKLLSLAPEKRVLVLSLIDELAGLRSTKNRRAAVKAARIAAKIQQQARS